MIVPREDGPDIVNHEDGVSFFCEYQGGSKYLLKIDDETLQEILEKRIHHLNAKVQGDN